MSSIAPGKRVLLTGANGFIAAHILGNLLNAGYTVRCTVRNEAKKRDVLAAHPAHASQLEFAIVPDIAQAGAFDEAIRADPPLDYILHTASPFHFNAKDMLRDMLEPAVQGTLNVLRAAKQYAPSVQRVVITSSFAAVVNPEKGLWPGKVYTEEDWNPITWEESQENASKAYYGSKKYAEKAAWDFLDQEKPSFDVVVLNPPMVFGPVVNVQTLSSLNTSNANIWRLLSGEATEIPTTGVPLWVDVRDLAKAHVTALDTPLASNKRILIVADKAYSNQQIADVLRANFPEYAERIPKGTPGAGLGTTEHYVASNELSKKALGMTYGKFDQMCIDLAHSLLKLEKIEKSA